MSKKNNLIPFKYMPGHWGLSGQPREIAQAYYELDGYDLDVRLIEINYKNDEYNKQKLIADAMLKHKVIDQETYDLKIIELDYEYKRIVESIYNIQLLDHNFKYGKLEEVEYSKKSATLKEEPWVRIVNVGFNKEEPSQGELELDWNDLFVAQLKEAGYEGFADEQIVNNWLSELCKNIAMETYSGVGNFDEIVETGANSVKTDKNLKEYK
jgi:hypothetical protein